MGFMAMRFVIVAVNKVQQPAIGFGLCFGTMKVIQGFMSFLDGQERTFNLALDRAVTRRPSEPRGM